MSCVGSLDTNVILRLLLRDVPKQHQAAKRLVENAPGQLAIADLAIIETAFVLTRNYGFTREHVQEVLTRLMLLPQINCNRNLFSIALPVYVVNPSVSLEDCVLATYAKLNDALPLYTFDKKLASHSPNAKLLL